MTFSAAVLLALSPIIAIAAAAVLVMLIAAFWTSRNGLAAITVLALAACFATLPFAARSAPIEVGSLLLIDRYALLYMGLLFLAALAVAGLAPPHVTDRTSQHGELYILLLTATLGAAVLVAASHFATFFLGLELVSLSLFALLAYHTERRRALEAGTKYLILSAVSTAVLLLGMSFVYAGLGMLTFEGIRQELAADTLDAYALTGSALILAGVAFKLSLVPFHMWTPDVYEGAPAPITAFLATVSKGAIFALLLRYFAQAGAYAYEPLMLALTVIAIASMLAGNVLALLQDNVKRILAYSSIAHLGYLLVAFLAGGALAVEAVSYYLAAYFVSTIGAFGVVAVLRDPAGGEAMQLADYRGLFWKRPWLATIFTLMLLSLAGIPLTMGFVAKFYAFAAGLAAALWLPVAALIIGSAIGLYYYLRVIVTLYLDTPAEATNAPVPLAGHVVLTGLTVLLIWLGVYPAPIVDLIGASLLAPG